jgi:DNA repair exonuclease SbcCD ATPase subunit|tara:strand:- start:2395 stop:4062 length:1668 start_codon:yes stop_codon:yes gene_type:complete
MKILKIEFKNFASYGNRVQVIEFDEHVSELYLVLGQNGSGKSTLAKVITYLCYGKSDGSNLRDMANRVNNNLWGKITLETRGNVVEIERGISPGVFEVKLNGSEYDVAGKANMQDFLETEIFEIPYHVFKNVIILSVNDFKSFITMSPWDKKQIIDRIFGFSVINQMREIVKSRRRGLGEDIKTFDDEIRTLEDSITSVLEKVTQFEAASKEKSDEKIMELKQKLLDLNSKRIKLKEANESAKLKISEADILLKTKNKKGSEVGSEISTLKKGINLYDNNQCPTCTAPLNTQFHKDLKKQKTGELDRLVEVHTTLRSESKEIETSLNGMREMIKQILIKGGQLENSMLTYKEELINLAESDGGEHDHLKDLIKDFKTKKTKKDQERLESAGQDNYLNVLENIMGEDGIKNLALRSILPSFNNHIMIMGKEMGIPFGIRFDDKFNCTLHHIGEEISPKTLSTGEKKKVDFVIIMALIKMIKMRFPSLNILFLDEIFSSIDASGVHHIINILHTTIQDIGLNTFVINHTVLPSEYFDKKLEITKDAGFSEFTIEKIK